MARAEYSVSGINYSSQTYAVLRGTQPMGGEVSLEDVTVQQALILLPDSASCPIYVSPRGEQAASHSCYLS